MSAFDQDSDSDEDFWDGPCLKPRDVGFFEPSKMPDPFAATWFIDCITTAVHFYGEEKVLAVGLRRCCKNKIAQDWYSDLSEKERDALRESTQAWERQIRQDFMPPKHILLDQLYAETFDWAQDRTPYNYLTRKLLLIRFAGMKDEDWMVHELHRGFERCPELYLHLEHVVRDPEEGRNRVSDYRRAVKKFQDGARLLYEHRVNSESTPRQCKCSNGFFGTGRKNDHPKHSEKPTPKPSECRKCHDEFPSRSRLHAHLRATGHHQRKSNRRQPEQYQRAFIGITLPSMATGTPTTTPLGPDEIYIPTPPSLDRFNNNTGYEGVTFKERGYQRTPVSDRASLSFSFKLTAKPPAFPSPLRSSSTLAEPETSTTRTSVPLPSQLPVRFSAIPPATSAAPRLPAPPPATRSLAALELRFASMLMGRAMICRRITRQLIRWQVRPGRLKRRAK
jgi:hypothetical protein